MKKTGFLGLLFLTLLMPVGLFAQTATSTSTGTTGTTGTTLDQNAQIQIIRPMLETYARRHPDEQVRIWSTIILANLTNMSTGTSGSTGTGTSGSTNTNTSSSTGTSGTSGTTSGVNIGLETLPYLVRQMGSRDENIRMIAMDSLRKLLNLDDASWRGIMTPVLITLAKNAKNVEAKKLAIKALGAIRKLGQAELSLLPMLFELAQNEDVDIRETANASIEELLAGGASGGGAGGGGIGRIQ